MQERGRAAIIRRLTSVPPRIALRQLLTGLSLAGIAPLAIVATVLRRERHAGDCKRG